MGFGVPSGHRRRAGRTSTNRGLLYRRRLHPDEHPGTGDGRRRKGNLVIVLMDNATSAWCISNRPCSTASGCSPRSSRPSPDFIKVAQGFRHCRRRSRSRHQSLCRPDGARSRRPGPCLIHASIDAEQKVYPMVPPGRQPRHDRSLNMNATNHQEHQALASVPCWKSTSITTPA